MSGKKDKVLDKPNQQANIGEQQNQQTQSAVLQLASNLLGNTNNLNQLTKKPGGGAKTIQEIEEEFLISAFQPGHSPVGSVGSGLSPEVIERIWWELRPWIEEYLRDPNQSILDHAREKFRRDVENWLNWQQREYNRQLKEYQKRLQELQRIEDLIREYQRIREQELLDKISRKTELRNKGYVDKDIETLKEWNLLDQEIPDLNAEKRIGATNILYTSGEEPNRIGGSCDLIIFLKPSNNQETNINFTIDLGEYKDYYKQIIRNFLTEKGKRNNDAYVLVRDLTSARGDSAGIAFYLTLHSLVNQIPLPRNLGSTGTVYGTKTGAIGGLNRKLEYNIKKQKPIDTFILSEENKNNEPRLSRDGRKVTHMYPQWDAYEDKEFSPFVKEKVKQAHFTRSTAEIETALQEILKEPEKKIIHSCGKGEFPEKKPEKPQPHEPPKPEKPNSKVTSEQLLTLITELSIREEQGENQDFWEKLQAAYGKNSKYLEAVNQVKNLRQEYVGKLEKLQKPDERNPDQGKKIRKFINASDGKTVRKEEEVGEDDKMTCRICHKPFKNGYTIFLALQNKTEEWWCSEHAPDAVKKGKIKVVEKKVGGKGPNEPNPEEIEKERQQLYQEYQQKFQKIAASVANLTNEILTNLEKNGYILQEVRWKDDKFQAPSLTGEPAVIFSLVRK